MKVPAKLKVGPFVYRVSDDKAEMNEKCRSESSDLLGHCDRRNCVIVVEPKQSNGQKRDTLLHEALHALTDVTGLESEMSDDDEEKLVRRLSPAILSLLRDNPKLVAFLVAP